MEIAVIQRGRGNLLEAQTDALVNTVNTDGVMGKGIALQFKRAYPEMFAEYQLAAKAGELRTGRMHVWETHAVHGPRFVINFPTKEHWKGRSKLEHITSGLDDLLRVVTELGIRSLALPPLGCGNGGLAWSTVRPIIEEAFADSPVKVVLFEPAGAPEASQMVERREPSPLTPGRALPLRSMERYREVALEEPSHLELQKLLYFLQLSGEPLKLRFTQHLYGPYADNLRHVLVRLEGHYIDGYGDGTDPVTQFTPIRLRCGLDYPASDAESFARLDRTMALCAGFSTPFGMELLGSVHWIAHTTSRSSMPHPPRSASGPGTSASADCSTHVTFRSRGTRLPTLDGSQRARLPRTSWVSLGRRLIPSAECRRDPVRTERMRPSDREARSPAPAQAGTYCNIVTVGGMRQGSRKHSAR